ncbi:hypothetical protein I79_023107 [Cricetulus griseus]|uniref:Uncharacterized protein n=1 Tax=Cricetulus griseus TaxID=10029 RepID=G3IH29_CRIGR|nr:hypothetical protein I79_023107 [Cricetulus griseus]
MCHPTVYKQIQCLIVLMLLVSNSAEMLIPFYSRIHCVQRLSYLGDVVLILAVQQGSKLQTTIEA